VNWEDVEKVLFDGTPEEIANTKCPDCAGDLKMSYYPAIKGMEIYCKSCGTLIRSNGVSHAPNFAKAPA